MWRRFSAYSLRVINYAQEETVKLGHDIVCTEHLLLGLIREPDCTAVKILLAMGVNTEQIRTEVEQQVTRGDKRPDQEIQLSVGAKKVIDIAMSEAKDMNSERVCSKHLLLGLIKKEDSVAGQVLHKLGVDLDRTRNEAANIYDVEITEADPAFSGVKKTENRPGPPFEIPAMRNGHKRYSKILSRNMALSFIQISSAVKVYSGSSEVIIQEKSSRYNWFCRLE